MSSKKTGFGDSVEEFTTKTGIKKMVEKLEAVFDFDCGCNERKEKLNKMFPYKVECLNEEEYNYLSTFDFNKSVLHNEEKIKLLIIYNRVFNRRQKNTNCGNCWRRIMSELRTLTDEYKKE